MSTFLQPGGDVAVDVVEEFAGLLDVLLQETLTGQTVSCKGSMEQPQLIPEDFDLQKDAESKHLYLKIFIIVFKDATYDDYKWLFFILLYNDNKVESNLKSNLIFIFIIKTRHCA